MSTGTRRDFYDDLIPLPGDVGLADVIYGNGYLDFTAGDITGVNIVITDNENGSGFDFDIANIIDSSAIVTIKANPEEKPYTGIVKLFSSQVQVASHSGTSIVLTGIPHSSWGDLRIYFKYAYQSNFPEGYSTTPKIVSGTLFNELDDLYITEEEFDALIDQSVKTDASPIFDSIDSIGYIKFDTSYGYSDGHSVGLLTWNDIDKTIDMHTDITGTILQIGQEMYVRCINKTGADITDGEVVLISGAQGQRPKIILAQADAEATSAGTLGLATSDIDDNDEGYVTTNGLVRGLDTSGPGDETWVAGDILYLSATVAGGITNVMPEAPDHSVVIGNCIVAHPDNGIIFVRVKNGELLSELHDVHIASVADNDTIQWNDSNSRWENRNYINISNIELKELASDPDNVASFGQLFTKSDNELYFIDGDGTTTKIAKHLGHALTNAYRNVTPSVIDEANIWYPVMISSEVESENFTFTVGNTGAITIFADAGDGQVTVTSAGHTLSTGDVVTIDGTTNYNGRFLIANATTDTFEITDTWNGNDGTGDFWHGDKLTADIAIDVDLEWHASASKSGGGSTEAEFALEHNGVINESSAIGRTIASISEGAMGGTTRINLAIGDVIYFVFTKDDTDNMTFRHLTIHIHSG